MSRLLRYASYDRVSLELKTTMTINIELQPDEERDLLERARASGSDLAGYIHQILQRHLRKVDSHQAQRINGGMLTLKDLIDEEAIERCA